VTVVARQAGSRTTTGAARVVGVVAARAVGTSSTVVAGVVNASMTVTARCAAKRATSGAARAVGVTYCLVSAKRATTGAVRGIGVVVARTAGGQVVPIEGGYIGGTTARANTVGVRPARANTTGAVAVRGNRVGATVTGGDWDG
jgi:hypothetical protein